jgi:NTP pyrophosphatase (non-canonical NTP hydrolase)
MTSDGMTLDDYQQSALRTVNPALSSDERLLDAVAGLAEEAGEVLGLVRKRIFQRRDASRDRLVEELGDVLWCLAITADALGISLADVAKANVQKLERRHPAGFQAPSST